MLSANYYRLSLRFQKPENLRKLNMLRREMSEKTEKPVSMSRLLETIVEQWLDKNWNRLQEEEKS